MATINLLPWRAERRKQREREFYMMLAATAVATLVVLFIAISWMGHLIDNQNDRNSYLQGQIKILDAQLVEIDKLDATRSQLLTRKSIIEQLQSNRSRMVHLFDDMVKTIPEGVRLTSMKQVGETLTLIGDAESNSRVASYMRNIDAAPWMGQTDLVKIENQSGKTGADKKLPYAFSLDVKLHKPEAQDQEADAGGEAVPAASGAIAPVSPATGVTPVPAAPVPPASAPATHPAPPAGKTQPPAPRAAPAATGGTK